jgi:hypothetical protein
VTNYLRCDDFDSLSAVHFAIDYKRHELGIT